MGLPFLEIYKRGLYRAWSVTLSKYITHYTPQSCFPYYKLIPPSPHSASRDPLNSSVVLGYGNICQVPSITDCSLENMNPDVTPHRMSLDISVLPKIIRKKKKMQQTPNFN
jgi:hypothetical protein